MSKNSEKTGHPVLGIILGVIGIVLGSILGLFAGVIGIVVGSIFGVVAILIGLHARKGKNEKGIGALVIGVISIVLSIVISFGVINNLKEIHNRAVASGSAPTVEKYTVNIPNTGFLGIMMDIKKDVDSQNDITTQEESAKKFQEVTDKFFDELKLLTAQQNTKQ